MLSFNLQTLQSDLPAVRKVNNIHHGVEQGHVWSQLWVTCSVQFAPASVEDHHTCWNSNKNLAYQTCAKLPNHSHDTCFHTSQCRYYQDLPSPLHNSDLSSLHSSSSLPFSSCLSLHHYMLSQVQLISLTHIHARTRAHAHTHTRTRELQDYKLSLPYWVGHT